MPADVRFRTTRPERNGWRCTPPGFLEYMEALGPDGTYGRWLRSNPVAVEIDEAVFLHVGLSVQNGAESVSEIVQRAADEIEGFDRYRRYLIERNIVLPFSVCGEILTAAALETDAWSIRLFPSPPEPDQPPPLTPTERREVDVLVAL